MRELDKSRVKDYVLAGNANITLKSGKTGKHYTYKIIQSKNDECLYFVKSLRGADNTSDYTYIGCYYSDSKRFYPEKKYRDVPNYSWPKSMQAINYLFKFLYNIPDILHVYHHGRCCVCGRMLTTPESIEEGIGPECRKR